MLRIAQPNRTTFFGLLSLLAAPTLAQQHSVARVWNEELLGNIIKDFARPPIQARNLFHVSAAMYDAWAAYSPSVDPWLLGHSRGGYTCAFDGIAQPADVEVARREAISFAAYRLIRHRFQNSPGAAVTLPPLDNLMDSLGFDRTNTSLDYLLGGPAELGNYIAAAYIAFGYQDGANESGNYAYQYYAPVNPSLHVEQPGNPSMIDPNRWQPITLTTAVDQQGNPVQATRPFITPEWGNVVPFAMSDADATELLRDGDTYKVYHDPGPPSYLDTLDASGLDSFFKWNHLLVPIWQSHLDPSDTTVWDISPGSVGNNLTYPATPAEYYNFYNFFNGNDSGQGHSLNPVTGLPYTPQLVKRGDYARVLAEFWADGPNSETPPGHWFSILHTVSDHPLFVRKWMGIGAELDPLEYDIKSYFALGGALHDAAISAWSIKGWYDSSRPVSAIRYMGDHGQCSDPQLPNYHSSGLPLLPGYVELVQPGDMLAGDSSQNVDKVKLYTWRGPSYITTPNTDTAGVGWILAENWFPYQRPTFVSPPFAGYVSGHSTYSRSAAEVLTMITGDPYFPGGMSNFLAPHDNFLVFENGPSQDVILQWATYRDASDQCSLSRIWGGIHPPMDDIPGRILGQVIGPDAVNTTNSLITADRPVVQSVTCSDPVLSAADIGNTVTVMVTYDRPMLLDSLPQVVFVVDDPILSNAISNMNMAWTSADSFTLTFALLSTSIRLDDIFMRITSGRSVVGLEQNAHLSARPFLIDTELPTVQLIAPQTPTLNDSIAAQGAYTVSLTFSEACDEMQTPDLTFTGGPEVAAALQLDVTNSNWTDNVHYEAVFMANDTELEMDGIGLFVTNVFDVVGNPIEPLIEDSLFNIDTRGPAIASIDVSDPVLNLMDLGSAALQMAFTFDEPMDPTALPVLQFTQDDPLAFSLSVNPFLTEWVDDHTWHLTYDLANGNEELLNIQAMLADIRDIAGNNLVQPDIPSPFIIDTHRPLVIGITPSLQTVADMHVGLGGLYVNVEFSEAMSNSQLPLIDLFSSDALGGSFQYSPSQSSWFNATTFHAVFNVTDVGLEVGSIGATVSFAADLAGNVQEEYTANDLLGLDTRNPVVISITPSTDQITDAEVGVGGFGITSAFDELMDPGSTPLVTFNGPPELNAILTYLPASSLWVDDTTFASVFTVTDIAALITGAGVTISMGRDVNGNIQAPSEWSDLFSVDLSGNGVGENANSGDLILFPNPSTTGSAFNAQLPAGSATVALRVMDIRGSLVFATRFTQHATGPVPVAIPHLAPGVYNVELTGTTIARRSQHLIVLGQ